MSTIDSLILKRMFRQLTEDMKLAEDRIAFLQDEEECARISLERARTEKARDIITYRCNPIPIREKEEERVNESLTKGQQQLSWVKIQLAVAEEEHDRLRDERQYLEDQIKNRNSPS
jgi:hypothetical protein